MDISKTTRCNASGVFTGASGFSFLVALPSALSERTQADQGEEAEAPGKTPKALELEAVEVSRQPKTPGLSDHLVCVAPGCSPVSSAECLTGTLQNFKV